MAINTCTVRVEGIATLLSVLKDLLTLDFAKRSSGVLDTTGGFVVVVGVGVGVGVEIVGVFSRSS